MPFEAVMEEADSRLSEAGFVALDELNGVIGGVRHGIWDYTWVAHRRFAPLCYAAFYTWRSSDETYNGEIWARLEGGRSDARSLVQQVVGATDPPDERTHHLILQSLAAAAERALRLTEQRVPEYVDEGVTEELEAAFETDDLTTSTGFGLRPRVPYGDLPDLIDRILSSGVERVWSNQQVLWALLAAGHATDRADVNNALSDLATSGRIRRLRRGRYSK